MQFVTVGQKLGARQLREVGCFSDLLHKLPTFHHFLQFYISTCLTRPALVPPSFVPPEPTTSRSLAISMGLLRVLSDFWCDLFLWENTGPKNGVDLFLGWRKYIFEILNLLWFFWEFWRFLRYLEIFWDFWDFWDFW